MLCRVVRTRQTPTTDWDPIQQLVPAFTIRLSALFPFGIIGNRKQGNMVCRMREIQQTGLLISDSTKKGQKNNNDNNESDNSKSGDDD